MSKKQPVLGAGYAESTANELKPTGKNPVGSKEKEMNQEEFRPIPELPGYFISSQGRVRRGNTKILRPFVRKYDEQYQITADGVRHQFAASKMVKLIFGATQAG